MSTTPETTAPTAASSSDTFPAALRLGPAHLVVTDLDRSVAFYQDALGLHVTDRDTRTAGVGTDAEPLLVLHERPQARPAGKHAGLYHVALNYGVREELARAALRLAATRTPIQGASDHGTHEAIYLPDPDGNGLELAHDRPREQWKTYEDFLTSGPRPLDTHALLRVVEGEEPTPLAAPGMRVGHLHLHVGDLDAAVAFSTAVLGFETQAVLGDVAAFVSAGGYHHHLGMNTWRGKGVPAAPADAVGLDHWTVVLPSAQDVAAARARVERAGAPVEEVDGGFRTRDPWATAVEIVAETR
ncbi:MAG TPA: VOC family protein [Solirubrobacteraceae bacterium]|nr:VOC family protein [Solirubrobacteraceae bacterium]